MNYLAHLFLAGEREEARIGSLLGDFEKGNIKGKYSREVEVEVEIEIHRKIDYYTDNHKVIKEAKKIFSEERKRYAGIVLDVFYDHILAKSWGNYSKVALDDFTREVYSILLKNKSVLPYKLNEIVPTMIEQDWLSSYQHFSGFEMAIDRISLRLKRSNSLLDCISDVEHSYDFLSSGFDIFFPELIDFVSSQRLLLVGT